MPNKDFVHLHNHSTYSFGDAISQIPDMVKHAKEMGMHSLALTDHGYGHGLLEFYKECKKQEIKPILGAEIYFTPKGRMIRTEDNRRSNHLVLLARNVIGYRNLIAILTSAATEGFYYKPRADWELLARHSDGLVCLTACLAGPVAVHMYDDKNASEDLDKAKDVLSQLKDIFKDNLFLEIQYHGMTPRNNCRIDPQSQLINNAFPLSKSLDVPLIITNDAHYITAQDWKLRDIIVADGCGTTVNDPLRKMRDDEHQYYLKDINQMWSIFGKYDHQILLNTVEVASRVELYDPGLELGNRLPKFPGSDSSTFRDIVRKGFTQCYPGATENSPAWKRLEHELKTIETLGFRDYFFIVKDFIDYAEKEKIPVGPGRGSAAGSIISYCMGITTLDPLEHNLLFERFLNPSRISLPDIDIDVCKERRGEVIDYICNRYGQDNVAQIITFNRLKGKGSIRAVGRALCISQDVQNDLSSVLPKDAGEFSVSLKEVVDGSPSAPHQAVQKFRSFANSSKANRDYIDAAVGLEGVYKSSGVHAAAVVIGPESLKNILPLKLSKNGSVCTQFSMEDVEDLGLLKMDFLGLDTLTFITNALQMISNDDPPGPLHGKNDVLTIRDLQEAVPNLNDPKVYKDIFNDGRTIGIFQCDSSGLRELLARMECNSFDDICAAISLYRPGPLDSGIVESFIKRRRGQEKEVLWHDELRPYLSKTHGLPIYQEQIMFASQVLCGFDMAKADNLRKVIGKKKKEAIAKFRTEFVTAAAQLGKITETQANKIYDDVELYGRYCFNLSHAASYAVVTYYSAWLKSYYPEYFVAALLNKFVATEIASGSETKSSKKNDDDLLRTYLLEAQAMKVCVLPPDIATSHFEFRPIDRRTVSYGLGSLKNVGAKVSSLIDLRYETGTFNTLADFVKACIDVGVNKRVAVSFVEAGCVDFGIDRQELLRVFNGYPRPKKTGEGLTKSSKSIFDDVRDLIKQHAKRDKKFKAMTDEEKSKYLEEKDTAYRDGMTELNAGLKKSTSSDILMIDPPGIYRISTEVKCQENTQST